MRKQSAPVQGEYTRVGQWTSHPAELENCYFTPITEMEAEYLIKFFHPNADVVFYPDIRSVATEMQGNFFIRLCNNPLTQEDIENKINYPRLQLGVVIHEIAHLNAGLYYGHGWKFVEALDALVVLVKDNGWKDLVNAAIERMKEMEASKKPAKSIAQLYQEKCPACGKQAKIKSQFEDDSNVYYELECNHLLIKEKEKKSLDIAGFKSINNEPLYKFQQETVEKFQTANGRLAILHEMGLGKTPCSIAIAHLYRKFPTLIVCKSGLRHQWKKQTEYWGNELDDLDIGTVNTQVIENSKDFCLSNMHFYIVSYDLLPLLKPDFFKKAKTLKNKEVPLDIKMIVLDECQHMKNPESQRTRAIFQVAQGIPNVLFLSGTPIKNNAIEFYPMLHMLDPMRFPNKAKFASEFVDTYMKGPYIKYGGIRNYKKFSEITDKFFIRKTQAEVLPDLPEITRNFVYTDLDAESNQEYSDVAKEFSDYYYNTQKEDRQFFQNILSYFTKMRHITGLAKVDEAFDFAVDFLESTDRKLAIFTHHIDVRELLVEKLNTYLQEKGMSECLELVGNMDSEEKEKLKDKFNFNPAYRILIASTLASGEGHNLQHACSDCLMLERQWNPANEEQAEFRFKRPGQKASAINATYLVALETIDEYFTKLVEQKRMIVKSSLDGTKIAWDQNTILMELAQNIAQRTNSTKQVKTHNWGNK